MLRGAMIGLGNVALHGHLPGWRGRDDVEIVAATDAEGHRRLERARHLPNARWYDSAADLLAAERLGFVDICTPPSSHAPLIRSALERGLHVLCEKPLVGSLGELAALARLATARGAVLHIVHNWHYAPIVARTARLIRDGQVGQVTRVVWHTLRTEPALARDERHGNWRVDPRVAGGGVLTDHGWHVSYLLRRWIGAHPTAVSARLETRRHTQWPVEDTATLRIAFPGATAEVLLTWAADVRRNWVEVTGTTGRIELHDDTLVLRRGTVEHRWPCPPGLSNGSHHPDWFGPVAEEFLARVRGESPAHANLTEAALCLALENQARESSRRDGEELPLRVPVLDGAL
jgi:predicted dehydrogenase